MKFKNIEIKNFRSFKTINVNLSNKNIFFGLNGVGKTNLLTAIRFVFDKKMRRVEFLDSDFFQKETEEDIEITVQMDISDESENSQKIRSVMKGAIHSDKDSVFIKLIVKYNFRDLIGESMMYWGSTLDHMEEIPQRGSRYELDNIFEVFYVDAYVDMNILFKKYIHNFIQNNSENESDEKINTEINELMTKLNDNIAKLSAISEFEEDIKPLYDLFNSDDSSLTIKSEVAVNGLYANLVPYLKGLNDSNIYPSSGEGRKKLVVYAMYTWLAKQERDRKINFFLIEEPENNLHKSLQLDLSHLLFDDSESYDYLFLATHSSYILYEMDNVSLIRIFSDNNVTSRSVVHEIPQEFKTNKRKLNRGLSEALFANRVLLVEGPSEYLLFDAVLTSMYPNYESQGKYILPINGVNFGPYYKILTQLNITTIVKTDNDVQWKNPHIKITGFQRINKLINETLLQTTYEDRAITSKEELNHKRWDISRQLYEENKVKLEEIATNSHVYVSHVDLENDVRDALTNARMKEISGAEDPVQYLQKSKNNNMVTFIEKLDKEDAKIIINHEYFMCVKDLVK